MSICPMELYTNINLNKKKTYKECKINVTIITLLVGFGDAMETRYKPQGHLQEH